MKGIVEFDEREIVVFLPGTGNLAAPAIGLRQVLKGVVCVVKRDVDEVRCIRGVAG